MPSPLERVLTQPDTLQASDLPHVLSAGLGGVVRSRLPEDHPLRPALRPQALDLALRHTHIRAEVRDLLRAWAAEGIIPLLLKGFALAEFEYTTPAERFYGDVDLLLPEDLPTVMRAAHIALAHGWRSDGQHADPSSWTHETMHLFGPSGHTRLDVHRWVVGQGTGASPARLRQLTRQVWQHAEVSDWDGLKVRRPRPLDAAVVNVALGRAWGGDSGGLKPADYLDMQLLQQRHGLSFSEMGHYAAQLGAAGTWASFAQLCNPERQHLQLEKTASLYRQGLRRDGLSFRRQLWRSRLHKLIRVRRLLLPALGDVLQAWWALRRGGDPRRHLGRWTPTEEPCSLPASALEDALAAVNCWVRLLYPRQFRRGVCVPRAYASYRLLRRLGHPAIFVSGAARRGGNFIAHAWVEDRHGPLEAYGEPANRQHFKVVFSFPDTP